jgi:hypothetical protein
LLADRRIRIQIHRYLRITDPIPGDPKTCGSGFRSGTLGRAHLFDEKIRQSAAGFWFGLRDVEILYSRVVIQGTIDIPAFLKQRYGGKIRTCKQ